MDDVYDIDGDIIDVVGILFNCLYFVDGTSVSNRYKGLDMLGVSTKS